MTKEEYETREKQRRRGTSNLTGLSTQHSDNNSGNTGGNEKPTFGGASSIVPNSDNSPSGNNHDHPKLNLDTKITIAQDISADSSPTPQLDCSFEGVMVPTVDLEGDQERKSSFDERAERRNPLATSQGSSSNHRNLTPTLGKSGNLA